MQLIKADIPLPGQGELARHQFSAANSAGAGSVAPRPVLALGQQQADLHGVALIGQMADQGQGFIVDADGEGDALAGALRSKPRQGRVSVSARGFRLARVICLSIRAYGGRPRAA